MQHTACQTHSYAGAVLQRDKLIVAQAGGISQDHRTRMRHTAHSTQTHGYAGAVLQRDKLIGAEAGGGCLGHKEGWGLVERL